jgi:hypothetical protein
LNRVETEGNEALELTEERLGEPDAVYRIGAGRFWTKFGIGVGLVVYGVIANIVAWEFNFWAVDHIGILVLFVPPITGLSILRQLYVNRGLAILIYPTGLLRIQGREMEAFPWAELDEVRIRADQATPLVLRDNAGKIVDCRLIVAAPVFRLGQGGVILKRSDGVQVDITPALGGYPELVEDICSRTFAIVGGAFLADVQAGNAVRNFGIWEWRSDTITQLKQKVLLSQVEGLQVSDKIAKLAVTEKAKLPWNQMLENISHPHLLFAAIEMLQSQQPD